MAEAAVVPASENYRPSTDPPRQCSTCLSFAAGVCTKFPGSPAVSPSYVCDAWAPPEPVHPPAQVGADHHNAVLQAGRARVDELEPRLVALLTPMLRRIGEEAARNFTRYATDHLTASGPLTGVKATSTMICVRPRLPEAEAIADPDGSPPSDLHVTLAYLGELEDDLEPIRAVLAPVAAVHGPLAGVVGGYGEFRPPGCGILLPDVPGLVELRVAVTQALVDAGIDYGRDHGFEPHLTVTGDPSHWAGNVPGTYAAHDSLGTGDEATGRGAPGGRVSDLRTEPLAGEPRLGEGERSDDLRPPDRLDSPGGSSAGDEPFASPLRERALPQREAHGAGDERGARPDPQPAEGDVFRSWHPVRFAQQPGMGRLSGLPPGGDAAAQGEEEGRAYPASACGHPLHFDSLLIVRGDVEQHDLPLVGPRQLTAAGSALPPDWTPPAADELVDADELVKLFRGKTDPIRLALIREVLGVAFGTPGMTAEEAIAYYHSPSAFGLNDALRTGKPLTVEQQSVVNALDAIMTPSEKDMVLWRGIPNAVDVLGTKSLSKIEGRNFETPGYLSTSETRETAELFASGIAGPGDSPLVQEIRVPKGTPMLQIPAGDYGDQQEWLLPRNLRIAMGSAERYTDPYGEETIHVLSTATSKGKLSGSRAGVAEGAGLSFDVSNPLIDGLIAQTGQHITSIVDTTRANVMRVVGSSYEAGLSIPDTAKAIRAVMVDAAPKRAIMIARTEMTSAVNGASLAAAQLIGGALDKPMTKTWLTAPGAPYPRHEDYDDLDGQTVPAEATFRVGEDELQYPGDPSGSPEEVINCFPAETPVEFPFLRAAMRRWYDGDLVRIRLSTGDVLAATPNHPVLRADGIWTPIGELNEGDYLVSATRLGQGVGAPDPDRPPSEIGEVYRLAAAGANPERVRLSPPNLHGDATDGEVEVVTLDGCLLLDREAASDEEVMEFGFSLTSFARLRLSGCDVGPVVEFRRRYIEGKATGLVSGAGERPSLPVAHALHAEHVRVGAASNWDGCLPEPPNDDAPIHSHRFGDSEDGFPALMAMPKVVQVDVEPFHGYVYNLDTGAGWYTASTVLCRNCRCAMTYSDGTEGETGE